MIQTETYEIFEIVNAFALLMGIIFGVVAQKTQFCFSGSIKDYILMSSTKRAASVIMAMITAIVSTYILTLFYDIDLSETVWLSDELNYFTIILGGCLFGSGMMIADGCSSRHLIKFAQGDNKSLVTLIFIAIFAYANTKGIFNTAIYTLSSNQTLIELSSYLVNTRLNIYVIVSILVIVLLLLTRSVKRIFTLYDGVIIGLLIALGWYLTGVYGAETLELETRYVPFTSMTFIGPISRTLELFTHYKTTYLDFGISVILGLLLGAFIMSKFNKKYSFGCVSNMKIHKLRNSMLGGALMGIGGIMSIGCTVGQGLTGFSTLAVASLIAILSIFFSGYFTGLYLNKNNQLPMCFTFDWKDDEKKL